MTREEAIEVIEQDIPCEHDIDLIVALEMAIKALEQNESAEKWYKLFVEKFESCEDAISREAVCEIIKGGVCTDQPEDIEYVCGLINELPPVTPSIRKGRWINDKNDIPICSQCGYIPQYDRAIDDYEYSNYCPSCGSEMESEE